MCRFWLPWHAPTVDPAPSARRKLCQEGVVGKKMSYPVNLQEFFAETEYSKYDGCVILDTLLVLSDTVASSYKLG